MEPKLEPRPRLEWVKTSALLIDSRYQRDMLSKSSRSLVKSISTGFDWSKFQTLTVTDNDDGTFNVIDGQHRAFASREIGVDALPCLIVETTMLADEAGSFVSINRDRVRLNPLQLYHAERIAQDESALQIARVCEASGISIPRSLVGSDQLKPGETLAVKSIKRVIYELGEGPVVEALNILRKAWPEVGGEITAAMIKALSHLVALDRANEGGRLIDHDRLIATIAERPSMDRQDAAMAFAKNLSIPTVVGLRIQLVVDYNKRLRGDKRLPWDR